MRVVRRAGVVFGTIFSAGLLGLTTATSALGANAVLMVGGVGAGDLRDEAMSRVLGGAFSDDHRVSVSWPAEAAPWTGEDDLTLDESIAVGKVNLTAALGEALQNLGPDDHITVVGLSAGSLVADEVLRELDDDPNAPSKDQLSFTLVADSSRQEVIDATRFNPTPPPDTQYDIIVVTGEYDGFADFPDRRWNLLAVVNAYAGIITVHVPAMFRDLSEVPAENITTTVNAEGGVTKHYLVPTDTLPIVQLVSFLKPFEESLKAAVDRGYTRNDDRGSSAPDDDPVYCAAIGCRPGEPGYPLGGSPAVDPPDDDPVYCAAIGCRPGEPGYPLGGSPAVNAELGVNDATVTTASPGVADAPDGLASEVGAAPTPIDLELETAGAADLADSNEAFPSDTAFARARLSLNAERDSIEAESGNAGESDLSSISGTTDNSEAAGDSSTGDANPSDSNSEGSSTSS